MRYLAQFSEAPRSGVSSFWQDAAATEDWLYLLGKSLGQRRLTMRARTTRTLKPWYAFQTQPLVIEGWLDPMETTVTWNYLVRFLAELALERVWVPCGEDSWIGWTGDKLTIRAARESWLWTLAEDIWDPAGWAERTELEWWAEGRLQHAVRLPWGLSEQRSWPTGWEEWTLTAARDSLLPLWVKLADRLGSRPLRVKWLQEEPRDEEALLGLPARFISCDLTGMGDAGWLERLSASAEPVHVRTQATWSLPEWSANWSTLLTLRRVQRGTRLEATYTPRRPMGRQLWQSLQRERRQIPMLQMRPLALNVTPGDLWERLCRESEMYRHQESLTRFLQNAAWPETAPDLPARLRPPGGWTIQRWASQPGLWVVGLANRVEVHIEWPTAAHPGNIGIAVAGAAPISMNEWVRASRFKRLSRNRRYWAGWIHQVLTPVLEQFCNSLPK